VKAHARVADAEERPQLPTSRRAALAAGVILPGLAGLATFPAIAAAVTTTTPTSTNTPLVDAAVAAGLPAQVDTIKLKGVGTVTALGIGAWSWGDRTGFWGWQSSYGKDDVYGAYRAAMDAGISREFLVKRVVVARWRLAVLFLARFTQRLSAAPPQRVSLHPTSWVCALHVPSKEHTWGVCPHESLIHFPSLQHVRSDRHRGSLRLWPL
jgi:hypothetical protein